MDPVRLLAVETALPAHRLDQATARDIARGVFADRLPGYDRLEAVFENSTVETRYLVRPPDWYLANIGWAARMAAFRLDALALLIDAAAKTLAAAGLAPGDVDHLVTVSTTGIATPSLDTHLIHHLGIRPTVGRTPVFGWGCAGGVLGFGRAAALARGDPGSVVLLLSVETCSLAFRADPDPVGVVGLSLFGDGAAGAVLCSRGEGALGAVSAWGEHCWPETDALMGWRIEDPGLGLELGRGLPGFVRDALALEVDAFLARCGRSRGDVQAVVAHPGGPKVIDAIRDSLTLEERDLAASRRVLRAVGNVSSAAIFFVLKDRLASGLPTPALLTAMGPGFTAAFAILDAG